MPPIRIASMNAENFSLLLDDDYTRAEVEGWDEAEYLGMNSSIYYPNKSRDKIAQIAEMILAGDYDVVGLCEVGGKQTLTAFNRLYLNDRYEVHLHEENSKRGIYVGALVRRGRFPWTRATNMPGAFARNVLKLSLGLDEGGVEVFVVHLKSQFGQNKGIEQRIREVEKLVALVRPRKCVVMGDFNGILIRGEAQFEYAPFLALPFRDVLEAMGVPEDQRRTHYHFGPEPHFTQLDYIFCSNDIDVVDAGVVEGEIPINRAQRNFLPSDHLMIWAAISVGAKKTSPPTAGVEPPEARPPWWQRLGRRWIFPIRGNSRLP